MSKCTAAASTIQVTATIPVLMLAFELGESELAPGVLDRLRREGSSQKDRFPRHRQP